MKILILENNEYQSIDKTPTIGRYYFLEDAEEGTLAQNNAFHALVQEWFKSGCYSYHAKNWLELKDFVKRDMGAGFVKYKYVKDGKMYDAKTIDDVPLDATDKAGVLKSWSKYTKKERIKTMDLLIATMIQSEVQTKKFYEILDGMENEKRNGK